MEDDMLVGRVRTTDGDLLEDYTEFGWVGVRGKGVNILGDRVRDRVFLIFLRPFDLVSGGT